MKLLQETQEPSTDRKLLKSQVEKRRRERMNMSLERLRNILSNELPQQAGTQQRVEKAEILEHAVLFLQNMTRGPGTRGPGTRRPGTQNLSFQDGFSSCLQRAAHFLGPQENQGASLDQHRSDSDPAQTRPGPASLTQTRSVLRLLRQKSGTGPYRRPPSGPEVPAASSGSSKLGRTQGHSLWRPWP